MMASNNYLGLTTHPAVVEASRKALEKYRAGAGSVPLLGGTLDLHKELEYKLAQLKGCEDALIFSSGYPSNVGCASALVRKGDVAINDRLNHASSIDGCRLQALRTFKHNDPESLRKITIMRGARPLGQLVIGTAFSVWMGTLLTCRPLKK